MSGGAFEDVPKTFQSMEHILSRVKGCCLPSHACKPYPHPRERDTKSHPMRRRFWFRMACPLLVSADPVLALVGGRHNVQLGPPWEPGAYWVNANRFLDVQMSSAGGRPTFDGLSSELDQSLPFRMAV
ncbi:hypothetical protein R3P38DRAFT_2778599 [Favolaschia claudopus]|uniref:Uncharacterized protein n=1 Tax=Favolaschia claudopus TaxID=2862362 RepID=A0AAW0BHF7_9AGAR